jgi:hypothetical protein
MGCFTLRSATYFRIQLENRDCSYIQYYPRIPPSNDEMGRSELKIQIVRLIRSRCASHIVDLSGTEPDDAAIYTLSDPREIRVVRYVGQTSSPRRRFLQHLTAAKLWLPDELPWWIKRPEMKSLYQWIRELYRDERRLPVMVVTTWAQASDALAQERDLICAHLRRQSPLLNRESETFKRQPHLL